MIKQSTTNLGFVMLSDGYDVAGIDRTLGALYVMDEIHAQIHKGQLFHVEHDILALSCNLHILTGLNAAHIVIKLSTEASARIILSEDVTVSANGTALVPVNRNRISAFVPTTQFFSGPTITAAGLNITNSLIIAGDKNHELGGTGGNFCEFIFRPLTSYHLNVTSLTGSAQQIAIQSFFYEVA